MKVLEPGNEKLPDKLAPLDAGPASNELVTADEATCEEEAAFVELGITDGATTRVDTEPDPETPDDCVEENVLTAREPLEFVPSCVRES